MKNNNVSQAVIRRLPRYYRYLGDLLNHGINRISSKELAEKMNLTASQIRQDL
ncbi:MAG: winged-helix domain-containing protein, partial [Oscillospiraceae bacterium]